MNYTQFAETMLIVLYQESESGSSDLRFEDLLLKYGLPRNERWVQRLTDEWKQNGLVDVDAFIGSPLKWHAEISGSGMREIESRYGDKDGVSAIIPPIVSHEESIERADVGPFSTEASEPDAVDSSKWTGLPSGYELTELRRLRLTEALAIAESDLDHLGASNAERAQARAYIIAVKALADAPEPPVDIIWNIINKAATVATIAQLFLPLIQAFMQ